MTDLLYYNKITESLQNGFLDLDTLIDSLLKEKQPELKKRYDLLQRYRATNGAPIYSRQRTEAQLTVVKIDNKIGCDFFSEICRDKSGFIAGNAPRYTPPEVASNDFTDWINEISLPKIEMQTALIAAVCGVSYRYYWYNDLNVYIDMLNPEEIVYLEDKNSAIAIRKYNDGINDYIEIYTSAMIYRFIYNVKKKSERLVLEEQRPHILKVCPIVQYCNDEYLMGDCEKATGIMDAYDRLFSDMCNEIEQFRAAYLKTSAVLPSGTDAIQDFLDQLQLTGIVSYGTGEIDFLVKNLDYAGFLSWLQRMEDLIYQFCSAVNNNPARVGSTVVSGVGLRHRREQMKNKCLVTIGEFQLANRKQFQILSNYWSFKRVASVDYRDFKVFYKLSFPVDIEGEARTLAILRGNISDETAYTICDFGVIENPQDEIQKLREQENAADINQILNATPTLPVQDLVAPEEETPVNA